MGQGEQRADRSSAGLLRRTIVYEVGGRVETGGSGTLRKGQSRYYSLSARKLSIMPHDAPSFLPMTTTFLPVHSSTMTTPQCNELQCYMQFPHHLLQMGSRILDGYTSVGCEWALWGGASRKCAESGAGGSEGYDLFGPGGGSGVE